MVSRLALSARRKMPRRSVSMLCLLAPRFSALATSHAPPKAA